MHDRMYLYETFVPNPLLQSSDRGKLRHIRNILSQFDLRVDPDAIDMTRNQAILTRIFCGSQPTKVS